MERAGAMGEAETIEEAEAREEDSTGMAVLVC